MAQSTFGKSFFEIPTGVKGTYQTWYGVGRLLTGWSLSLTSEQTRNLLQKWPFCSRHKNKVLLPIPGSFSEFKYLNHVLKDIGIPLPEEIKKLAEGSVNNGELRFDLSHCPKMGSKLIVPGLKTPDGFPEPMFDFQEVAVRYVQSLGYRALVGDDMGLGKTTVGIASALLFGAKRVIIVTRSVALGSWRRALERWSDYPVITAQGKSPAKTRRKDGVITIPKGVALLNQGLNDFPEGVVLLNYEILPAWLDALSKFDAEFMILDEVHAVKEPKAGRSQAAYTLMNDIPGVVGLTGTPINNRPVELYPILQNIQPGRWGDFFPFALRYCDAQRKVIGRDWKNCTIVELPDGRKIKKPEEKFAWDFSGSKRETELYRRLRSNIMVRRLKDDVLDLLPPIEETIPLKPSDRYWKVESGELSIIEGMTSTDHTDRKNAEVSLHQLFAAAAMDKIDWVKEWLEAFLEDTDQKLVIFFHYQRVGEALRDLLTTWNIGHVNLWGTKPDTGGDHTFQTEKTCRVALCSYSMAREAVTLTEAAYQLAMEYPWVPGWAEQARDRTRRIGQKRAVTYYYPVLVGSAEERIVRGMLSKQDIISVITQGMLRGGIGLDTSILTTTP